MSGPDRIWVNLDSNEDSCCPVENHPQGDGMYFNAATATEYVRADLAPQWQDIATAAIAREERLRLILDDLIDLHDNDTSGGDMHTRVESARAALSDLAP